jgi:HTH-type transcriptional regulator/antitoxin HigA
MMSIKIIRNKIEYEKAFSQLMQLTATDPVKGSDKCNLIDVLSLLIEKYEKENCQIDLPDPISAIEYRMEQEKLTRKDMAVYLGTASRVSEILTKKKSLNLSMIRNLHEGLGIPYDVLMQEQSAVLCDYSSYPLKAIYKAGYFDQCVSSFAEFKSRAEELIQGLFNSTKGQVIPAHLRSTTNANNGTSKKIMDTFALSVWQAQVLKLAKNSTCVTTRCDIKSINLSFLREILKLSKYSDGPIKAKAELAKHGIHLIALPHLPKTYLDGAAMLGEDGNPVIGISLRYDRLDNFWFVLMHELAHVSKHIKNAEDVCFDDMENLEESIKEAEADEMALSALMPVNDWERIANLIVTQETVISVAKQYKVHPSIIAGRCRKHKKDYRIFNRLIGSKEVRKQFEL